MGDLSNTIEIKAPVSKVWETIHDFHDMSWAPGVITDVKKVGDKKGSEIGAQRILNDAFHETLIKLDSDGHTFSYTIDDGPDPVSNTSVQSYIGTVQLTTAGDNTLVEWSASFNSARENEVEDFCNAIYRALLSALKDTLS
ncbi:MAG: SRPBCC family protein [Desulfocapsaceae bacterium]